MAEPCTTFRVSKRVHRVLAKFAKAQRRTQQATLEQIIIDAIRGPGSTSDHGARADSQATTANT